LIVGVIRIDNANRHGIAKFSFQPIHDG
jgi:hypothetical protein